MKNSRISGMLGISVIVATVFMLGTAVVTAAISVSAFPSGRVYPTGPTRSSILEAQGQH
jgi:hypothetical protein